MNYAFRVGDRLKVKAGSANSALPSGGNGTVTVANGDYLSVEWDHRGYAPSGGWHFSRFEPINEGPSKRFWPDLPHKGTEEGSEAVRSAETQPESGSRGDALAQGERMQEYGHPKVSFDRIGALWSAYLSAPEVDPENLTGEDVGHLMILLKVSRSITDKKPDTLDDAEGYVSCIRMLRDAST